MERIKPPSELDIESLNLAETWREWKEAWNLYNISSGLSEKEDKIQIATIQSVLGARARRVLKTLPNINVDITARTVTGIVAALEAYCIPRKNVTHERYVFRMTVQEDRTFDTYLTDLRRKAERCEFGTIKDSLIRDQIVIGTNNVALRERLLRESELTLEKTINLCRISEQSKEHLKILSSAQTSDVDSVSRSGPTKQAWKPPNNDSTTQRIMKCKFCASSHDKGKCPAFGATCYNCNGRNHYARCCSKSSNGTYGRNVRGVEVETRNEDYSLAETKGLYIGEVQGNSRKNIRSQLLINEIPVNFKLDTGAECNIIPMNLVDQLGGGQIEPTNMLLKSFGGYRLDTVGKCHLGTRLDNSQSSKPLEYYVVRNDVKPLLGLESCLDLGLLSIHDKVEQIGLSVDEVKQKDNLLDEFNDVFEGLGCVEGEYEIKLKDNACPTTQPQRNVPVRLLDKLKETIDDLESKNVIAKVDEPVEWVSNLVIVEKKDKSLRLCLDPPDLNAAIEREDFKPPTFENISSTLNGCKVFTVVDMSNCYWHQKLTENSSYLCTFNTPHGRYRFKRMPFGISCASEVAQKMVEKNFGDIQGALPIFDDIIVGGKTEEEHDAALRKVLTRARERNIKFNRAKIQFRVSQVKYMGEIVSKEGFAPDPDKISAICDMPTPSCKQDLQRLLGMINYLSKYIPNMSELTSLLRSLLKKDVPWSWFPEHDAALAKLKSVLSSAPVLRFYDTDLPTTLQVDASKNGLGACLLQNGQPVAYASRAMSTSEQNYAQIEKELLAIVFGCERFHMYTYGTEVEIHSDHKPLESIFKKALYKVPPRLQRMRLRLQKYCIKVKYVPGKFLQIADTLSRAFNASNIPVDNDMHKEMENLIHSVVKNLPISDIKLKDLREITRKDHTMQMLSKYAREGWPEQKCNLPLSLKLFWNVRNDIYLIDGLLLKDNRLIIPSEWKRDVLQKLHTGHFGIEKCKAKARKTVFWPNMTKDIEEMVNKCEDCLKYQCKQTKEPMQTHEIPVLPWQIISSDILEFKNTNYVVVIDYYSKYIEALRLTGKKATDVIKRLDEIFARHGYPEKMIADNMPYDSREMRNYANSCGINIETISPTYSQSNGLAEKAVHIVKNILRKGCDLNQGLMEHRNTPISNFPFSPNQLLLSRQIRTKIPVHPSVLVPQVCDNVPDLLRDRQIKTKKYYDQQGSKELQKLNEGDCIRFRKPGDKYYSPARVTTKLEAPRSYMITDDTGRNYRRNRRHIHLSREPPIEIRQNLDNDLEPENIDLITDSEPLDLPEVNNALPELRRSTRSKYTPNWHKDYIINK